MLCLLSSFAAAYPKWPASYTMRATWKVPYTNLSNPLIVVQEPKRQYTDENNGLLRIWNTGVEERIHRKTVIADDKTICYGWSKDTPWDIEFTQFLPDLSDFTKKEGTYTYNGILCDLYEKFVDSAKASTYKMYVDKKTQYPVCYWAKAVSIYGSHYDVYVLEIHEFIPEAIPGVWNLPDICNNPEIEDDPYPGAMYDLFFPQKDGSVQTRDNLERVAKSVKSYKQGPTKFLHLDEKRFLRNVVRSHKFKSDETFEDDPMWDECGVFKGSKGFKPPVNFSWRDVPGIVGKPRDQVACGSCWAFGTAELLESAFALKRGVFEEVSVNQVLDCTWDARNYGCQGGEVGPALTSLRNQSAHIATEKEYPYLGTSGMCERTIQKPIGTIKDCFHVEPIKNSVKEALYKHGPLAISINVIGEMGLYTGGVFDEKSCTGTDDEMVHIVQLTGWKEIDGKDAWEVKNSWSTHWGDEGYIYIQADNQEWNCGVTTRAVGVVVDVE